MAALPPDSADLVVCSPPYEDARLYLEEGEDPGIAMGTEEWVAWMVKVVNAALRVCKGMCAFVVGHGKQEDYKWTAGPALLLADLHRSGVCLRNPKWFHRVGICGSGGRDDLRKDVEFIVCATRDRGELPFQDIKAVSKKWKYHPGGKISHREQDGRRVTEKTLRVAHGYEKGDTKYEHVKRSINTDHANPGDLLSGAVGGGRMGSNISHENEAPYPEWLPEFFVKAWCPPGGVVLDPFMGSGTTAAAAIKHDRKFIGIDLRKSQIELTKRRVAQARRKVGLKP
jgi:site-specific DNA-methyltransferase (adenine-specific)/site-specific DNA-methyltransferase (cytosine-N4-specific)